MHNEAEDLKCVRWINTMISIQLSIIKKAIEINVFKADTLKWHILVTEHHSIIVKVLHVNSVWNERAGNIYTLQ